MAKDYYALLGVARQSTQEEIKKAYRRLAHQHHPDKKGGDEKRFKEINEAYQVLSNPAKRRQYDQFGRVADDNFGAGGWGGGWSNEGFNWNVGFDNVEDIFSGLGGWGSIFGDFFSRAASQVQVPLEVPLSIAVLGGTISFRNPYAGDEVVEVKIPAASQNGTTVVLKDKGMSFRGRRGDIGRGDLIVVVNVKIPSRLSREQYRLFEELKKAGL